MPRRMLLLTAVIAALGTAACSDGARRLAEPSGPVFRLNPDRWADAVPPTGRAATQ